MSEVSVREPRGDLPFTEWSGVSKGGEGTVYGTRSGPGLEV